MNGSRTPLSLALVAALAGCAVFSPPGSGGRPEAMRHPDKRFAVRYGADDFVVDVRFIDVINESVIAVRQGRGSEGDRREPLEVPPNRTVPAEVGFADEAYRAVAVDIADAITGKPPICPQGQTMRLARRDDETARTLFRPLRAAWVVFAFCPAPEGTVAAQ